MEYWSFVRMVILNYYKQVQNYELKKIKSDILLFNFDNVELMDCLNKGINKNLFFIYILYFKKKQI